MPKRSGTRKPRADDPNVAAHAVLQRLTGEDQAPAAAETKNAAAVALGRLGGKKGGAARAAAMTAEQRAEAARIAAAARWKKS